MGDGGICKMHLIMMMMMMVMVMVMVVMVVMVMMMMMVPAMQKLNPGIGNSSNVQKGTYKREEGGTEKKKKKEDDWSASDTLSAVPMFLQVAPQEGSCSSEDG